MTDLHFVVPDTIDHPGRPSGGNVYDRRVAAHLPSLGWVVHEHAMSGRWPEPEQGDLDVLARVAAGLPDGALLVVDGLVASCAADVLVPESARLRIVVLVHLPLGGRSTGGGELRVLSAAAAVVATSAWTRRELLRLYPIDPTRLHVATPGVDPAPLAAGTDTGEQLLCVAAVTPDKGYDLLVAALARVAELPWRCVCVGSLTLAPALVDDLKRETRVAGIQERVSFVGPLSRGDLDEAYAAADVLVLASRAETYGMVVTEALARGLPVVATEVGGLPEALGRLADGARPGLLVPSGSVEALAAALRTWLTDAQARRRLRSLAAERRKGLSDWSVTARQLSDVLRGCG